MMGTVTIPNMREFDQKGREALKRLQVELLPEHAEEIVALDPYTGDYALGPDGKEALRRFREQYPGRIAWMARADGGPVYSYRNRLKHVG